MKRIRFAIKTLFVCTLIVWIALKFDVAAAKQILLHADAGWAIAALLVSAVASIFASMRWEMIIRGICPGTKASIGKLYAFNLSATFYSIFLPTAIAGEAVRVYKLRCSLDTDYMRSTVSVIIDRIFGVGVWLMLFMITPSPFQGYRWLVWFLVPAGMVVFAVRKKIVLGGYRVIDFSRHHPMDVIAALFFSMVAQSLFVAANYSLLRCFGVSIGIIPITGLTAACTMTGIIPLSLLGIGLREGAFLTLLPLYGASTTQAALFTSGMILGNFIFGLAGGIIELSHSGWNFAKMRSQTSVFKHSGEKAGRDA